MDFLHSLWLANKLVIKSALTSTAFIGIIGFTFRGWISHKFSCNFETHKEKLRKETEEQLTKHKSELDRFAYEHQIRFSSLHQKRADVIEEMYGLLWVTEVSFQELTSRLRSINDPPPDEKVEAYNSHAQAFIKYYQTHRIHLEESVCQKINSFADTLRDGVINHQFWLGGATLASREDNIELFRAVDKSRKLLTEIRLDVERAFRGILGVSNEPKQENKSVE